jgi:two-component system, NtrC family, sensor histidine kinase KinB
MLSLRYRIALTLLPQLVLLAVLGGAGVFMLQYVGNLIDRILRENYDSVHYMQDLDDALDRIDSSFLLALVGREPQARDQYQDNWAVYESNLAKEEKNITLPGEGERAKELRELTTQ